MKLLLAFFLAFLVSLSRQVDWAELVDLSEEDANAALGNSFFSTPNGATGVESASEHAGSSQSTPWNALRQHSFDPVSDRHHDLTLVDSSAPLEAHQPSRAPNAGDEFYPILESGAVQPVALRSSGRLHAHQPAEASSTLDLPELSFLDPRNPPQALTVEQRHHILQEAAKTLKLMAPELEANEAPFRGTEVAAVLLDEFKTSIYPMFEYKPGFLLRPRSSDSRFWPAGLTRPVLEEEAARQLIVYRYALLRPVRRPRTVFQVVGLLRHNQDSHYLLRYFSRYRSRRNLLEAVGADCFVDRSALVLSP